MKQLFYLQSNVRIVNKLAKHLFVINMVKDSKPILKANAESTNFSQVWNILSAAILRRKRQHKNTFLM